ncbi:MAG TPA: MarR family transcriptional regulator [Steroidobacteraceae bacterium]|nr:MarR family transcriptional regulator [Steroidobacteraceae bacterium]
MADIYDAQTYEPRKGVGHLLNRVRTEMLAAVDKALAADAGLASLEVSSAQFIILATLGMGKGSASDLCKGISYDAGAMTRMIDRLEDKGLLRRNRSPDDRRLVNLELTEAGQAALPRMREVSMGVLNRFLRGFTKAEARQLESFLTRMLENASGA